MKYTAIIALIMLTACNPRQPHQRDIVADIIARAKYAHRRSQSQSLTVIWNVCSNNFRGNQSMPPQEAPPEALPAPYGAVVWSPVTKQWYDKNGNLVY